MAKTVIFLALTSWSLGIIFIQISDDNSWIIHHLQGVGLPYMLAQSKKYSVKIFARKLKVVNEGPLICRVFLCWGKNCNSLCNGSDFFNSVLYFCYVKFCLMLRLRGKYYWYSFIYWDHIQVLTWPAFSEFYVE